MRTKHARQSLWFLFLICAFPLHLWTIVFGLMDMSWATARTNLWDAIGVISYGLVFAFLESLTVWLAAVLLSFLLPRHWDANRRVALLGLLVLITAGWSMVNSLYFLVGQPFLAPVLTLLAQSGHPLRLLYAFSTTLALASVALPLFLCLRSESFCQKVQGALSSLTLLSGVYLLLDMAGLIIVIIRNL